MATGFAFRVETIRFDEDYHPSGNTRITTNFANLARGDSRRSNLLNALGMINRRCNSLISWDNPGSERYSVILDIISADMISTATGDVFPVIEMLKTSIFDKENDRRIAGIVGNNFSSYLRDYDFSIVFPKFKNEISGHRLPDDFGDLHGRVFRAFVNSDAYRAQSAKPPVICLSVSHDKVYQRLENRHPVLGVEYRPAETSLTEAYFRKMGMKARYFMPDNGRAPLAFYFSGDLLNDYTALELIGTISTMETFQKIYRPEIYNANAAAGACFRPSLTQQDYSLTRITYDREERGRLAVAQGRFAEETFIIPHQDALREWSARFDS